MDKQPTTTESVRIRDEVEQDGCGGIYFRGRCNGCGKWQSIAVPAEIERKIILSYQRRTASEIN